DLGMEGGYVDFGSPSDSFPGFTSSLDASGFNLWGIAGVDVGPLGLFGKVGAIAWDLDGQTRGIVDQDFDESGTDAGYGIGVKFMLFSAEVRAEYERYEVEDGIDMFSVGLNWVF
ncbi:MAG: outer membrane beta-barrel protein, partial [Pseudomonadota bacterium]